MSKNQTEQHASIEVMYPRYISNQPKGEDMFKGKSQERLAQAIAAHISETDSANNTVFARLIGVEGKWGSGKSNVIKLLEYELNKNGSYTFFAFDAWGNQEDLQRRSILELLTKYLISNKKLTGMTTMRVMKPEGEGKVEETPCTWKEKLESLLSRKSYTRDITVPSLNGWTKVFVLILLITGLLIPLLDLVAKDLCWWAQLAIILGPMLLFLFIAAVTKNLSPMWKMYNTEGKSDTTSFVISEQEPSVREFKEWMHEVSNGLPKNEWLVIVFDNMDRLPSEKVHQFWSLIQTFFADDGYKNIWCIIPYDEEHLASAFSDSTQETEQLKLLRCFLDKTFPVVFRVPEPIVSDYKNLFAELLNEAYGDTMDEDDKELVSRCFRHLHPTPNVREIISFINKTVTLTKQWGTAIHPISMALYTLKEHDLLRNPLVDRTNNAKTEKVKVTTEEYILDGGFYEGLLQVLKGSEAKTYLRKEIAAIVYGIQPNEAMQIVAKRYIRNCFTGKVKDGSLNTYASNPQFVVMLDEEVHDMETSVDIKVVELIHQIDENKLTDEAKKDLKKVWQFISHQYLALPDKPTTFSDFESTLFSHQPKALAERCVNAFCERILANSDVNGGKLFVQLENLFNTPFAAQFDATTVCPPTILGATRFLDYVEKAGDKYGKYPVSADAKEVNSVLIKSLGETFSYYGALKQLKDNTNYTVKEIAGYAVAEFNKKTATSAVAYHLISVQRLFFNKFQSQLDSNYTNTLWQAVQGDANVESYDELYVLRAATVLEQLAETDRHINALFEKSLFYTTTTKLFKDIIANRNINCRRKLIIKMVKECKHDNTPDYAEFIQNWEPLRAILGVEQQEIILFADSWGVKQLSEGDMSKNFFQLLPNTWIDALLANQTTLVKALLEKCVTEMTAQAQTQFAVANTANHTGTDWDEAFKKLIASPYITSGNMGNLNQLAGQLLDAVARTGVALDESWNNLLQKVDYANISGSVVEIRNKILNGQSGYEMTPAKFKVLHNWLRCSDIQTRRDDAANQILAKVIDDVECQALMLEAKEYYVPIISETIETASGLHSNLKKILAEQGETEFAKYAGGLVKYRESNKE